MKKIGLVTYYGDNYGGCLQAYALQTSINTMGYNCEIIAYDIMDDLRKPSFFQKLRSVGNPIKYIKKRNIMRRNNKNSAIRAACFENFRSKYLNISARNKRASELYLNPPVYDAYVCGSDQIWNPYLTDSNNPVYYLDFAPNGKKRIAYAPSIGVSHIHEKYQSDMTEYLTNIDHISVREIDGANIIKKLTGKDVPVVLDPTLLLNENEWNIVGNTVKITKPYILCYLFGDMDYITNAKMHFKKLTNLPVISLPYNTREMDSDDIKIYNAGPFEFVELIRNAKLILTDSFHATVFSINLNKPFYSFVRESTSLPNMNSRLYSFLKSVFLEHRIIEPNHSFPERNIFDVDFSRTQNNLNKQRNNSLAYLAKALKE